MEISARLHILVVAAGSGNRLGGDIPKQYRILGGLPVLWYSLQTFLSMPETASVTVVISPEHENLYRDAIAGLDLNKPVIGGKDRKESVANGLKALSHLGTEDIVLIHDAARPFISVQDIRRLAAAVEKTAAASLACPVSDTLKRADGSYIDRDGLWAVQTPQAFRYGLITAAHQSASGVYTDDTSLAAAAGHAVEMVAGSRQNFKITTPEDWAFAEEIMRSQTETRMGTGFDVHAFATDKPGKIILCGIEVPHAQGLEGHSDADVGLHALTDALLGAMALGDIGQHFPPSDPQWKDAASDRFLKHAVDLITSKGGRIVNLDLTLICEAPKIGLHREAMQKSVAAICGIAPHRVSIKATTTEKLGFTGRKEGIAAQAAACVEMPYGS